MIVECDGVKVWVCPSCMAGTPHEGDDCKNLSGDRRKQCACNHEWPELYETIKKGGTNE